MELGHNELTYRRKNGSLSSAKVSILRDTTETKNCGEESAAIMPVAPAALWVAKDPECNEIVGNKLVNEFYKAVNGRVRESEFVQTAR